MKLSDVSVCLGKSGSIWMEVCYFKGVVWRGVVEGGGVVWSLFSLSHRFFIKSTLGWYYMQPCK